jgi:hypothetical protein
VQLLSYSTATRTVAASCWQAHLVSWRVLLIRGSEALEHILVSIACGMIYQAQYPAGLSLRPTCACGVRPSNWATAIGLPRLCRRASKLQQYCQQPQKVSWFSHAESRAVCGRPHATGSQGGLHCLVVCQVQHSSRLFSDQYWPSSLMISLLASRSVHTVAAWLGSVLSLRWGFWGEILPMIVCLLQPGLRHLALAELSMIRVVLHVRAAATVPSLLHVHL